MNHLEVQLSKLLDKDWLDWVKTNLERQVPVETLAKTLSEHGKAEAGRVLLQGDDNVKHDYPIPQINLDKNHLVLSDGKQVDIVFSCDKPYVVVLENFLSLEECQTLINVTENKFEDARVIDPETGQFVQHQARTSMNAAFIRGENEIVRTIEQRIAETINWDVDRGEGMQVLRYQIGGEYKAHYDFFDANKVGGQKNMAVGGQRVGTFLMYLSDVEAGGATRFPNMSFEVRPKAGMALYFGDVLASGLPDEKTLHSSVPVVEGVKYIATKWLREKTYG